MSAESQHGNRSLARGHEERDVYFRPIVIASVILFVTILVSVAAMRVLFVYYLNREARLSPPANPLAVASGPRLPPEPRLLPRPIEQLQRLHAEEKEALDTYGWIDRERGVVRIPIERAMELMAQRGLPATEKVTQARPAATDARDLP